MTSTPPGSPQPARRILSEVEVVSLHVSPGHNFFGHHGQPPGAHPTLEVDSIRCLAGRGIEGDRFLGFRDNYKGQITFLSEEVLRDVCRRGAWDVASGGVARRNVVTRGIDLNELVGVEFELQGVRFQGTEECRPCEWMNHAIGPGAEELLRGRGGLRARILSDGILRRTARHPSPRKP